MNVPASCFSWKCVDEEFHPAKSGVCGYYVKRSLKPKFILKDKAAVQRHACPLFNTNFSACKLITDGKSHKL